MSGDQTPLVVQPNSDVKMGDAETVSDLGGGARSTPTRLPRNSPAFHTIFYKALDPLTAEVQSMRVNHNDGYEISYSSFDLLKNGIAHLRDMVKNNVEPMEQEIARLQAHVAELEKTYEETTRILSAIMEGAQEKQERSKTLQLEVDRLNKALVESQQALINFLSHPPSGSTLEPPITITRDTPVGRTDYLRPVRPYGVPPDLEDSRWNHCSSSSTPQPPHRFAPSNPDRQYDRDSAPRPAIVPLQTVIDAKYKGGVCPSIGGY